MSETYQVTVDITAPVNPTEVDERVAEAITSLFPTADPELRHGELTATVHDLEHLSECLHRQEILDTARGVFFDNRRGDAFSFRLKKGPALQGVVNFTVGDASELGDIAVHVRVDEPDLESYVDHVAPPTEDGTPVDT
jgi:predicted RNA binding protein with dsRBD fold (UPF0201 family)